MCQRKADLQTGMHIEVTMFGRKNVEWFSSPTPPGLAKEVPLLELVVCDHAQDQVSISQDYGGTHLKSLFFAGGSEINNVYKLGSFIHVPP